ncbi:2-amino-4-hydroxy-6-hydroxymethyldihydropteridine diphosphokinase [Dokdonella soli]|uniref:2-amino-4-hydroxy-6-hydroxymethyldihydropteridine pyrophosphokinase n=1 Tax=Dokdonella soli TaxID=529810 RepID=A0ABN1IC45_9GAMM
MNEARAVERAYVALGSNLDEPQRQIRLAFEALGRIPDTRLLRRSRLYRSAPWGITEQPAFVNAVAELATALGPRELLEALLAIEREQGRRRDGMRWGPRTLDLDLLIWGGMQSTQPGLELPHPRIADRAFVLVPLAELDADLVIPGVGIVRDLLARVDANECVPID